MLAQRNEFKAIYRDNGVLIILFPTAEKVCKKAAAWKEWLKISEYF